MANALTINRNGGLTRSDPRRMSLFMKTVGKDLIGPEIDEAIEWCELYGANPFTRDIYFFVFDAKDADKRRVVPVLGIGLYRKIAARSGNYRPDEQAPRFTYDDAKICAANPKGIVDCEVTVFKFSHGDWHPVTSKLKWEERAPIKAGGGRWIDTGEKWPDTGKPKRRKVEDDSEPTLDEKKTNWHAMPETMLAKCTEADVIRKGWPNETSGSYLPEELDQARTIELTATEIVATHDTANRLEKVGAEKLLVDWMDGEPLQQVAIGQLGDRAMEHIAKMMQPGDEQPGAVLAWWKKNEPTMREYWARDKSGALALKSQIERVEKFAGGA
jgi:phage recombination protein Bet